jgi:hypothetical protein
MNNHLEALSNLKEMTKPTEEIGGKIQKTSKIVQKNMDKGTVLVRENKYKQKEIEQTTKNIPVIVKGEVTTNENSKLISDISSCDSHRTNKETNLSANT